MTPFPSFKRRNASGAKQGSNIGGLATWALVALGAVAVAAPRAQAHFIELIPSGDVLPNGGALTLDLRFTHPFEGGPQMDMGAPAAFSVTQNGETRDLTSRLVDTGMGFGVSHFLSEPGAAIFAVSPVPYWEGGESKFIRQYTKVIVDSYASGEGWDTLIGLPVEIEPLVRPTGLWVGNQFSGVVRKNGAPVPFALIEVEYRNDGTVIAPNDAFITQVLKADANGTFSYVMPRAGWWGFAALTIGDVPMDSPSGMPAPVEEDAVIWVQAHDMPLVP